MAMYSRRIKLNAFFNEFRSQHQQEGIVNLQQGDGHSPNGSSADNDLAGELKVIAPAVPARMEKSNGPGSRCDDVDSGQVRSLVAVAEGTNTRPTKLSGIDPGRARR